MYKSGLQPESSQAHHPIERRRIGRRNLPLHAIG